MQYKRELTQTIIERISNNPVVALLGPRQCGKTTLAMEIGKKFPKPTYIDLENPQDYAKLIDPLAYLNLHKDSLVIIDEIQLRPDLFPVLRSYVDQTQRKCHLLILGSASRDLIRQSSESLAGRVSYIELTPFLYQEVPNISQHEQVNRGMFPLSLLSNSDDISFQWRYDYVRSIIEQELPLLGLQIPPIELRRFMTMIAHSHGELLNAQKLAESLGITGKTLKAHLSYLEGAFLVRTLPPYSKNLKKWLVKSPKIYYRDSGILHALLFIESYTDLLGHPMFGNVWEGYVIEQIVGAINDRWSASFFRTHSGAEINLIIEKGEIKIAIECKCSTAPKVSKGFWNALNDLDIAPDRSWIIAPVQEAYPYKNGTTVGNIEHIIEWIRNL